MPGLWYLEINGFLAYIFRFNDDGPRDDSVHHIWLFGVGSCLSRDRQVCQKNK